VASLIRSLIRPYRGTLFIIFVAMLLHTAMSVAAPWPLKMVLDNVLGSHKLPLWIHDLIPGIVNRGNKMDIAIFAALATVAIAVVSAVASYIANYCTTSVGQWVANDLRVRTYHHLQQLSLHYYDGHETGTLLSTITSDLPRSALKPAPEASGRNSGEAAER
jgi:subfamily B ATP-binding cassette protein MsbA